MQNKKRRSSRTKESAKVLELIGEEGGCAAGVEGAKLAKENGLILMLKRGGKLLENLKLAPVGSSGD